MNGWPWSELGLDGPSALGEVKRAYAQKIKTAHPEDDPEGFSRLHRAYQAARQLAGSGHTPQSLDFGPLSFVETEKPPDPPKYADNDAEIPFEDYERLFAEGDAEREEIRRRRAEKRLQEAQERRRTQEKIQRDRALENEEAWSAAYEALHALEVLWSGEVSKEEWILFFHSSTFLNAQHNLDFIFGLEDFLAEHPSLPDEVRRHIYLTYKFYTGKPDTPYLGLYRMLESDGKKVRKKIPWRKRIRADLPPVILLCILLSALTIDFFFLNSTGRNQNAFPAGSSPAVSETVPEPQKDPEQAGIETAKKLAVSLAAQDYPGPYALTDAGTASSRDNPGEKFYWAQCTGQTDGGDTLVMNYFLSVDGTRIYCISDAQNAGDVISLVKTGATAAGGKTVDIYRCAVA
ncbi:MAG: hypothetical protein K2O18_13245 [Oscillospiraceae bacterium]|nr:hypothetical protein [Oscillospiraceae bacterium]